MLSNKKYNNNKEIKQWEYLYINNYKKSERITGKIYKISHKYCP